MAIYLHKLIKIFDNKIINEDNVDCRIVYKILLVVVLELFFSISQVYNNFLD